MDQANLISILAKAMYLTLWLSLPTIIVASVVGTLFSLFQALTQIQEQTLTFVPKLVVVGLVFVLTLPWMLQSIVSYTRAILVGLADLPR